MAFIIPEANPRAGSDHLLRPDSSTTMYEHSSMTSLMPLSDIPETGFLIEPLTFDFDDRQKSQDVELLEIRDKSYYSTEEEYSQSSGPQYREKTRTSCQFVKPNLGYRRNSVGRTTTEGKHHRFIDDSSSEPTDSKPSKKRGERSISSTVIKSPVDKNGNALSFQKPLPRQKNCESFLGSWRKELGKGQVRRILSTGEVLDKSGQLKYVVKFLSPLTFRIPQGSGRAIMASLKQDGLYLELDNGEIWVKKDHMFDFSIHRVDNMQCCVLLW